MPLLFAYYLNSFDLFFDFWSKESKRTILRPDKKGVQ